MDKPTDLEKLEHAWQDAEALRRSYQYAGDWLREGEQARRTIELENKIRVLNPDWSKP